MKTHLIVLQLIAILTLAPSAFSQVSPELRYNFEYSCNKERIVIGHCRKDSDMAGYPPTKPEDDYCQVYYPDRPKTGGFDAMGTVLRADVIKTLSACGAMQKAQPVSEAPREDANDADAEFEIGKASYDKKDYAPAVDHFKRSAAMGNSFAAYLYLGISYYNLNKYPEAIDALKTTVDMVPAMPEGHYWLGVAYTASAQYPSGESEIREAIRRKEDYQGAYVWLGIVLSKQKKNPEAIKSFQEALRLKPDDTATIYSMGLIYARMGQKEDAMQAQRKLAALDKKLAQELLDDIDKPAATNSAPKPVAKPSAAAVPKSPK